MDLNSAMRKSHPLLRTEQAPHPTPVFITLASRLVGIVKPVNSTCHANIVKLGEKKKKHWRETSRG